jgi:hypothetical protein
MKATAMIPSKFIKQGDVDPPKLVTIKALRQANVAMDDQPEEMKWTVLFKELEKPMVLNSTNIQLLTKALGTDETDEWVGKQVVLYNDPNVSFGGKITGGVRIRAPKKASAAQPAAADFDDDVPL